MDLIQVNAVANQYRPEILLPALVHYCQIEDLRKAGKRLGDRLDSIEVNHNLVRQGDYIYVVSVVEDAVILVSRLILDNIVPSKAGLFPLVAPMGKVRFSSDCGTTIHFERKIPRSVLVTLQLADISATASPFPSLLTGSTPRGLRVITLSSAISLDEIIDADD